MAQPQEIQELSALLDEFGGVVYTINGVKSSREDYMAITETRVADALEELVNLGRALLQQRGVVTPAPPPAAPGPGTGMFGG